MHTSYVAVSITLSSVVDVCAPARDCHSTVDRNTTVGQLKEVEVGLVDRRGCKPVI